MSDHRRPTYLTGMAHQWVDVGLQDDRHLTCAMESDVLPEERTALVILAREQCLDIQNELFNPLTGWKTLVNATDLLSWSITLNVDGS